LRVKAEKQIDMVQYMHNNEDQVINLNGDFLIRFKLIIIPACPIKDAHLFLRETQMRKGN
jgi:hypothetical protein